MGGPPAPGGLGNHKPQLPPLQSLPHIQQHLPPPAQHPAAYYQQYGPPYPAPYYQQAQQMQMQPQHMQAQNPQHAHHANQGHIQQPYQAGAYAYAQQGRPFPAFGQSNAAAPRPVSMVPPAKQKKILKITDPNTKEEVDLKSLAGGGTGELFV